MSHSIHLQIYQKIFDILPVGLFLIDKDKKIQVWNQWMVMNTEIPAIKAIGQTISSLYPTQSHLRFEYALTQALEEGYPQVLSSVLNRFVIPMPLNKKSYPDLSMMQQNVEILSVDYQKQRFALVVVQDVSDKIHLKNTLISMAAKFEKNSLLDTLTGLYNRRFLWKYLNSELLSAERERYNVVCCLYDLDHFKKINDQFGHVVGDEVLYTFAQLAKTISRPNDYLFRYGGEEFIMILTHVTIEAAEALANRLRQKLEATSFGHQIKQVTCSGGVAYWRPNDPPLKARELIEKADKEMYKAKKLGRNRIMIS